MSEATSGPEGLIEGPVDFDPARLSAYLGGGEVRIRRISGGQSNPTYFVDHGGRALVLRKKPNGDLLPSAHQVDREYRVMAALDGSGVPAPRMIALVEDPEVIGAAFYLMERLDGRVEHDSALPGWSAAERAEGYADLARVLARLHGVDWAAAGLEGFGRPENYFARQIARWTRNWNTARTREDANIEALSTWLAANVPADDAPTIVHGDYRIGNVIWAKDAPRVLGVLDWELSTLGQPLADLAHAACFWEFEPGQLGGVQGLDLDRLGIPDLAGFARTYAAAGGSDTALSPFHRAFALFRFAVIFEGIAARHQAGSAAGEDAAAVGALSAPAAAKAAAILAGSAGWTAA
ncbi:Predicted kinase, aminoglycoside phosphotransferase (APT) family [Albimonas donghaensis]|uniref:Predicted kinase, aminoglycoside phosphotransferase (APT) family n=1 Tax=Albimonas donghaensis TaxID=356660 RepID=A0A1H3AH54_9RHOB|nr:phosphotransferase family protein [Albimonas donghaensis]SDX28159.1 Predicted kinase, aminoglycoside phosphotransferase (APT) family [Albimonas donghaensis]